MNCIQVARSELGRVLLFPRQPKWERPQVVLEAEEGDQIFCLRIEAELGYWDLEIRGCHYGSPCLPIALWARQHCVVVALGCRLHFLNFEDASTLGQRDLHDELYISDLTVESVLERLVVATARSLFVFSTPEKPMWYARDIASDGVAIRSASSGELVVQCEEPGDTPSTRRFTIDAGGK